MTQQTNGTPELKYSKELFNELYEVLKMLSKHRGLYGRLSDHDRDVMNEVIAKVEGV